MIRYYREYGYDIWGNKKDGYQVNDCYRRGIVEIDDQKDLIKELRKQGLIKKGVRTKSVRIDGEHGHAFYITDNRNGMPAFELRHEEVIDIVTPW